MSELCLNCHQEIRALVMNPKSLHGTLIKDLSKANCRDCHTEHLGPVGTLTRMDIANFPHDATGFSLKAHSLHAEGSSFTCGDCHAKNSNQFTPKTCIDCHSQLNADFQANHTATFGTECLACHDGIDTYGKTFDHARTSFPLTGKHSLPDCQECHVGSSSVQTLKETSQDCSSCHNQDDLHQGQLGPQCAACHSPDGWIPALFDHAISAFPLVGRHSSVECSACHTNGVFKGTAKDCSACHAKDDHHNGQMGSDCGLCHIAEGWDHIIFDHSRSKFPLTGTHAGLPCAQCHAEGKFTGKSSQCSTCHAEPTFHAGLFEVNCAICHTTSAWQPAVYNRPHSFPINHAGASSCRDCHTSTLSTWTCFNCHNQDEMANKHREEGINDFNNCLSCHANGSAEGGGD